MIQNTIGVDIKIVPNGDPGGMDRAVHDAIAKKAFQIFESQGRTAGGEQQDWILAESKVVRPLWSGVLETEDAVEISTDLSGFEVRSGIEIATEPGRLMISGVERVENERDNREPTTCLPSRIFGIVNLPTAVDATRIESHLTGHVLQIRVPKAIHVEPSYCGETGRKTSHRTVVPRRSKDAVLRADEAGFRSQKTQESKRSFKRILIAVDDSEFAARAAEVGVELAKPLKAQVGFIHVFDPSVGPGATWGVPTDRLTEMSEQAAKHLVATFRQRTVLRSGVREFVEPGKPASKIIETANNWDADLIVMGSHGRGKMGGLLLGSVSEEVLHYAPCPVLVVRPETELSRRKSAGAVGLPATAQP